MLYSRSIRVTAAVITAALTIGLAGCGGSGGGEPRPAGTDQPATKSEGSRFLAQATFGPTEATIDALAYSGFNYWFDDQFAVEQTSHLAHWNMMVARLAEGESVSTNWLYESFYTRAATAPDQLRQRVAFALSQYFVISLQDTNVAQFPRGVAHYMDMLGINAFGNFRQLLEDVSLHPMMGLYLTHRGNQKEDPTRNRVPDENYAREVMQLFTIGLHELNLDGTVKLDSRNEPIETYTIDDITGLAKVFTGFSWGGPDKTDARFFGNTAAANRDIIPMQSYPKFHSVSEKRFLGTTIAAQGTADPDASLRVALDRLFNHPNLGPFFGKQLIQKMVTSNPSPAYVARVATVFNNNGSGVRGDMKAVIKAVLTDPEARDASKVNDPNWGKVREPVMRLTAWMRAFNSASVSGKFMVGTTDDPNNSLGQTPMRAPTVFNFFRPGYVPPNTMIATAGLVAPELQIANEASVSGYLNYIRSVVQNGVGANSPRDVQPNYAYEISIADDPDKLLDRINLLLLNGTMPATLRQQIRDSVSSVTISTTNATNAATARRNRVLLATFLAMASPEFLVQK